MGALLSGFINVRALVCDTIDEVMAKLKAGAEAAAPGAWVMAKGFDPSLTKGNANITRRELDAVAPNNPLFMLNASGHLAYVNSKAIELSGVTEATPDPGAGGHYFKGPDGKLTGQLAGGTSYAPFLRLAPQPTPQSLIAAATVELNNAAKVGCTMLVDCRSRRLRRHRRTRDPKSDHRKRPLARAACRHDGLQPHGRMAETSRRQTERRRRLAPPARFQVLGRRLEPRQHRLPCANAI